MNEELKCCPFCGGKAIINTIEPHTHLLAKFMLDYAGETFIECSNCTCCINAKTEKEAITVWNKRTCSCKKQEV